VRKASFCSKEYRGRMEGTALIFFIVSAALKVEEDITCAVENPVPSMLLLVFRQRDVQP
jgi:hypothetical protein